MTEAEKLYRRILTDLRREYQHVVLQVVKLGPGVALDQWGNLRDSLQEALQMTDVVAASKLHWRAFHESTLVPSGPGVTVSDVIAENAWLNRHVQQTNPMILATANRVARIEHDYYLRRWEQGKLTQEKFEASKSPLWRLEMFYRTTLGDVGATSQQVELANPDVGVNFPFAEYRSRDDARVRPTHAAMDGFVALRSWPGWSRARPKCGYNCRCVLRFYSRFEAVQKGWMTESGKPRFVVRWPNSIARANWNQDKFPDPGWFGPKFVAPGADLEASAA